jgi:hypothetical protein
MSSHLAINVLRIVLHLSDLQPGKLYLMNQICKPNLRCCASDDSVKLVVLAAIKRGELVSELQGWFCAQKLTSFGSPRASCPFCCSLIFNREGDLRNYRRYARPCYQSFWGRKLGHARKPRPGRTRWPMVLKSSIAIGSDENQKSNMRYQSILLIALLTLPTIAQVNTGSSSPISTSVNDYPTLDSNRIYSPGAQVRVDEPHGVSTGLILMDNYYFLRLLDVTDSKRKSEVGMPSSFTVTGSLVANVRHAISPSWQKMPFTYACDNLDFKVGRMELAG